MVVGLLLAIRTLQNRGCLTARNAAALGGTTVANLPFGFVVLTHAPTGQLFLLNVVWAALGWSAFRRW